jgi:hypothetical protein
VNARSRDACGASTAAWGGGRTTENRRCDTSGCLANPRHGAAGASPQPRKPHHCIHPAGAQEAPHLRAGGDLRPQAVAPVALGVGGSTMRVACPRLRPALRSSSIRGRRDAVRAPSSSWKDFPRHPLGIVVQPLPRLRSGHALGAVLRETVLTIYVLSSQ